ncbi:MAG: transposase [Desulfobulbaceae bacterium]|nr:transposase [Desulfobulbaceae bacterium]
MKVQKTHPRMVTTLHIGKFYARETILECGKCDCKCRSEQLCNLVPPGANFGYDVLVYVGEALYIRHRSEEEVVAELHEKNIQISPRGVSLLGRKFIVYLAIAHGRCSDDITKAMRLRGGYIFHLDATCEGRDPILMSSLDSISQIVLGNVKLPAEDQKHIVPFLQRIKKSFGIPVALVHDMGGGILKAVAKVFPEVPDFICHFHFLRDIGKDLLGDPYDIIRKRLRKHQISAKLRRRAKQLKPVTDQNLELIDLLETGIKDGLPPMTLLDRLTDLNAYTLIMWALEGKSAGDGYGFPFDRPHLSFAKRIRQLHDHLAILIKNRRQSQGNKSAVQIHNDLQKIIKDKILWNAVEELEKRVLVFERLRKAMRIAQSSGRYGLNDEGGEIDVRTIEFRVKKFRTWLTGRKDYSQSRDEQKMVAQIDKYWGKLFADPITVQTVSGTIKIQPQRTNNILEQFFRELKRGNRRKTGNKSCSRMLRTMLAETPLVKNLLNPDYMKILLKNKTSLAEVFAEIEIDILREEFKKANSSPEKIPLKIKRLIAMPDYPKKLMEMVEKNVVLS